MYAPRSGNRSKGQLGRVYDDAFAGAHIVYVCVNPPYHEALFMTVARERDEADPGLPPLVPTPGQRRYGVGAGSVVLVDPSADPARHLRGTTARVVFDHAWFMGSTTSEQRLWTEWAADQRARTGA